MVLIDPHEIHEDFLTVPININIAGWSMHHIGGSPNSFSKKAINPKSVPKFLSRLASLSEGVTDWRTSSRAKVSVAQFFFYP